MQSDIKTAIWKKYFFIAAFAKENEGVNIDDEVL